MKYSYYILSVLAPAIMSYMASKTENFFVCSYQWGGHWTFVGVGRHYGCWCPWTQKSDHLSPFCLPTPFREKTTATKSIDKFHWGSGSWCCALILLEHIIYFKSGLMNSFLELQERERERERERAREREREREPWEWALL